MDGFGGPQAHALPEEYPSCAVGCSFHGTRVIIMTREEEQSSPDWKEMYERIKKERDEYLAGWQRARADLLNYKKEEMERVAGFVEATQESLLCKLLPLMDNFEIIERHLSDDLKGDDEVKGLLQAKVQLGDFLKSQGAEGFDSLGKKFDPQVHEAIEEVQKEGVEPGLVVEEIQKGYKIKNRLLRPAKVKVSK